MKSENAFFISLQLIEQCSKFNILYQGTELPMSIKYTKLLKLLFIYHLFIVPIKIHLT